MRNNQAGMTLIVKTVTRLSVGLVLIYGIYIVLQGHLSPGGGFAGGIIIALSFINLTLAFGKGEVLKKINEARGVFLASLGIAAFLFIVTLSFISRQQRYSAGGQFKLFSAGFIPLCDIAVSLIVGVGIFVIFLVLVQLNEAEERK
jgi:multicomponent Na+:H+ antiporter subunit B